MALVVLISGCVDKPEGAVSDDLQVINLEHSSLKTVSLDSIVANVRFVTLETNDECLIEKYDDIQVFGDKIFVVSKSGIQEAIFIFDLEGRFLGKVDALGRGPGEYRNLMAYFINTKDETVGVIDFTSRLNVYDYGGNYLFSRQFRSFEAGESAFWFHDLHYFTVDEMTPFFEESEGLSEFNAIIVYDHSLEPYTQTFALKRNLFAPYVESPRVRPFVATEEELFFLHRFGDRIYKVDKGELEPIYHLDFGKHKNPDIEETIAMMNNDLRGAVVNYLIPNSLQHPGETGFALTKKYIWFQTAVGGQLYQILHKPEKEKSIRVELTTTVADRNLTNIRPEMYRSYQEGFYGYIGAEELLFLYEYGNYHDQHSLDGILSPVNVPGIDSLDPQDNAILLFFEIRSDVFDHL